MLAGEIRFRSPGSEFHAIGLMTTDTRKFLRVEIIAGAYYYNGDRGVQPCHMYTR